MANGKPVWILTIDGGGIRGIIPALILKELESRLQSVNKKQPLHKYFRLISGTSTGGIIAAGLAAPRPGSKKKAASTPAELVELYRDHGQRIFDRNFFRRLREAVLDPASIIQEKYDAHNLEGELRDRLGMAKISDTLTDVMMTAYDIGNRRTVFMSSMRTQGGNPPDDYYFWEAARATSAAPTYFEPARVRNLTKNRTETLVDGGVFANHPGMAAAIEMLKSDTSLSFADLRILSLGTGYQNRPFEFDAARNWGPISWISPANGAPIISIFMHGQSDATSFQLSQVLNTGGVTRFYRIDHELVFGNDDMDDASETNIRALEQLAREMISQHSADLDQIATDI